MLGKINKEFVLRTNEPGKWRDTELKGFCLKVTPASKKIFVVETSVRGGPSKVTVTIGTFGAWTVEEARKEGKRLLALMAQGVNPNDLKKEEQANKKAEKEREESIKKQKTTTLSKVLSDYLRSRHQLKESTKYIYECVIKSSLEDWLEVPVDEITKEMVEKRHREITESGKKGAANHVMRILRALMTYASLTYSKHDGQPLISANPVKRLSEIKAWNKLERRQGIIRNHELPKWYQAVQNLKHEVVRDYLEFLIFTGLRKSEAANLTWDDIDFNQKTILIRDPKNRQPHMLPMTPRLEWILGKRKKSSAANIVFEPVRHGEALSDLRTDIAKIEEATGIQFTLHDLRRTFITTAEGLDIPYYAIKRLANHKDSSDVTVGYIISDVERLREPMQKISDCLESRMKATAHTVKSGKRKKTTSKVVPLQRSR